MTGTAPTIAITGAAGYIGSRVVADITNTHPDWEVRGFDNFYVGALREVAGIDITHLDVRDRSRLEDALSGADVIMHLAAISGVDDCASNPDLAYEVNVQGTANVAWWCRKDGAGLVFPFSVGVVGDPREYPITVSHPRDPLNWYTRTKHLNERAVETLAEGAFPAHLFMKGNLYGHHDVDGREISKSTVINFFLDRALAGDPLTVYEPGTQSRNYVHVKDVAEAYVRSAERLVESLDNGETGARAYEIASDEDPSVMTVAELVREIVADEHGEGVDVTLVENPRTAETLVDDFEIDTSRVRDELGWEATRSIEGTIRELVEDPSE
ncbi:oxidoreductase [Halobacteriales archaeon QH_6_64_20]|nr:MAG: oxidoreductase [Halobacteriales archaeon QH_6_64_20]